MSKKTYASAPKAVHDCRELLLWIIPQIDKLPRIRRYSLGEKLENRLLTVLESLVTAAYAPNKNGSSKEVSKSLNDSLFLFLLLFKVNQKGIMQVV